MMTRIALASVAFAVAIAPGCDSGPKLVAVKGVVTYEDKPLEEAVISFFPDASNKEGKPGEAISDQQGNYSALTMGRTGLVPGRYKVMVTKSLVDPSAAGGEQFQDDSFMLQMTLTDANTASGNAGRKKKSKPDKIDAQFDRDVAMEGAVINLDVTPKTAGK